MWNNHADLIVNEASKKLYSLRILCRAGVAQDNILKVYLSTVRPVIEYDDGRLIPDYLSDVIERVQRRALRKIYPEAESYTEALQLPNLKKRTWEIHDFCVKSYMDKMKSKDHPLHFLLPRPLINQPEYNLRKNADKERRRQGSRNPTFPVAVSEK